MKNKIRDVKDHYDWSYYETHSSRYEKNDYFNQKRTKNIFKLINVKKGDRVLDLGCGVGRIMIESSKRGAKVSGIDYSKTSIKIAKELFRKYGNGKAVFKIGNVTKMPFKNESFNKIIAADLVEHLTEEDYLKMLRECHRILNKNGEVAIYTPNQSHLTEILKKYNFILKEDKSHIGIKKMNYLIISLENNNFKIIKKYYTPNQIKYLDLIEKIFINFPVIGNFFRKRICILVEKI